MAPRVARAAWAAVPGHWPRAAPSPDHVSTCSKAPRADTPRPTLPADAETNTAVPSHRHPHSTYAATSSHAAPASPRPTGDVCGSLGGRGVLQLCPDGHDLRSNLWAGAAA